MKTERISGGQLIAMMFWAIMGTAVLTLPVLIGIHAPRDAWMAAVIFTLGGIPLSLIVGALSKKMENMNFIHFLEVVFGMVIGKIMAALFLTWLFHATALVIWQTGNFTRKSLLPNTPFLFTILILLLPVIYGAYKGLEAMSRSSHVIFMLTFLPLFVLFLLNIPDFDPENLLPVLDDGIIPVLRSSLAPLAWAGEIVLVLFFVPNITPRNKTGTYAVYTILLIGIGGIMNELFYTAVFGPLRQHLSNPFLALIKHIPPTAFIERYDVVFSTVNILGNFVKMSVFVYALVQGCSQFFGQKNNKVLIPPIIGILLFITLRAVRSQTALIHYLDSVFPLHTIPLLYGLPLLTLITARFIKKINHI